MSDEWNIQLVTSAPAVDQLNEEFYATFQYPWAPMTIEKLMDPYYDMGMLSQSIGSWDKGLLPPNPSLWVAGCGTNQAALTAVRFPTANVLGSDLSSRSLETCADTAKQLGLTNLTLKKESITEVEYCEKFDYIICTGVIHHTADPQASLASLARALKPSGVMLLMVYNRFHRFAVTAFQKAVRMLEYVEAKPDFPLELQLAKKLLAESDLERLANRLPFKEEDSALADAVIQPVEYSYTVESLETLTEQCNLELLTPYIDPFGQAGNNYLWNLNFHDPDLRQRYEALPDSRRWQLTNLLLGDRSPMLWFYLQRKDSGRNRPSEPDLCEMFLERAFTKSQTERQIYVRRPTGLYELLPARRPYPGNHPEPICRQIVEQVAQGSSSSMRQILQRSGIEMSFYEVNRLRLNLTTQAFPFLRAATMPSPAG